MIFIVIDSRIFIKGILVVGYLLSGSNKIIFIEGEWEYKLSELF